MTKVDKSDERLFDRIKEDWTQRYSDLRQRLQWQTGLPERRRIIVIDQLGLQVNSWTKYGQSVKGTKAHKSMPAMRSRVYSDRS